MNILKNSWHMARRFKTATTLNLADLTVAFAAFYLLMTQVDYNRSYNRNIADGDRVYRLETKMNAEAAWGTYCNRRMHAIIAKMPQVEAVSELACWSESRLIVVGDRKVEHQVTGTNLTPFGAIAARCLDGRLSWDDYGEKSALIPASLARKLYGRVDAVGQSFCHKTDTLTVHGVYEDFPDNCSMKNHIYYPTSFAMEDLSEWSYNLFVKLLPGVDGTTLLQGFGKQVKQQLMQQLMGDALDRGDMVEADKAEFERQFDAHFGGEEFRLRPIRETYFSGVADGDKGNPAMLFVLELACVLIIVIAAINFLNFTLAESPMRIKGVNTRRVLGEGVGRLRLGLVGESVVTALLACGLALLLCAAMTSQHTRLLQGSLALGDHWWLVALMVALAVGVGLAAGTYPAFFATSFQPALVLKGSFGLTPKGRRLRTMLVGLQLGIALLMVSYIGILLLQSRFIYQSGYGFQKDEVLCAVLNDELMDKKEAVRGELMQLGGVSNVSYSRFMLGTRDSYMGWGRGDDEHTITFTCMPVDCHYLKTMGIKIVEGRDFNEHDGDVYIINEAARRQWPWVEIDKELLKNDMPVVGICEDIRYASTRKDRTQEPVVFLVMGNRYVKAYDMANVVNVRVAKGIDKLQMRRQLHDKLTSMSGGEDIEVLFLDEQLEQLYQDEFRFIRQVGWFSVVCLVITLIGVFCLTMFETEYRRKEIGIRKVFGSTTAEVLRLLCHRYVWLLAVSFAVGAPLAWYIGRQWLQSFVERTPVYWWLFPLALLIVALITLGTVVIQSWRTANENPIHSIKSE